MSRRRLGPAGLLAATAVSQVGNVVAVLTLPWFVLETTGSAARAGLTAFATAVPLALGAVVAGPVVDRLGNRRAAVLSDLGAAGAIAGIPLLYAADRLGFGLLLALSFAAGALEAPGRTARRAMLPDLAVRAGFSLERTNSVTTTTEHLGYVLGAPLTGVLITGVGTADALWLDAASFVASALIVLLCVPAVRVATIRPPLLGGLRFVVRSPIIRTFFIIWTVGAFVVTPLSGLLLPVYANQRFGSAAALGATITALGVGGLLGTLFFAVAGRRVPRRRAFVTMWVAYPLLSCLLIFLPGLPALLAVLAAIGFVTGAYDPLEVTIHQENTPPDLRPQVFAVLLAAEMTAVPVSILVYGLLIDVAGLRAAAVLFGGGNLLLGGYALRARAARDLRSPALSSPDRLLVRKRRGSQPGMSEQPWGIDADNPVGEGSEPTAVPDGSIGEQRAGQDPTAQDGTDVRTHDRPPAYDPDQEHAPQAGEQGGQPNLSPDPAVAGRRSNLGQGSTDDGPGTPSGL